MTGGRTRRCKAVRGPDSMAPGHRAEGSDVDVGEGEDGVARAAVGHAGVRDR
jgi:hypothetical protein